MSNSTDGYYCVVVEGETHLNRTVIKSDIQFFTRQGGYSYCHPEEGAMKNAQAIADGLNGAINIEEAYIAGYEKRAEQSELYHDLPSELSAKSCYLKFKSEQENIKLEA